MCMQPYDNGRGVPQQMNARVGVIGPKQPERNDKSRCDEIRANALKKQRAALRT